MRAFRGAVGARRGRSPDELAALAELVNEPGTWNWSDLNTRDPEGAKVFYGELFGWTSGEFMDMGEHGEYRFFAHAGTTIGA